MAIHKPVLLKEALDFLKVEKGKRFIDATVGEGGHALAIAQRGGIVLGIDQDPRILEQAKRSLGNKAVLIQGNFKEIERIARENIFTEVDGILMDLGISSWHLKESGRGFSFQKDEPLDMRADPNLSVTAADLLNGLTKNELKELFQKYGEEERAPQLAAAVVRARSLKPFRTTADLVGVVEKVRRTKDARRDRIHPATKIFQALRIAVNDEVENLRSVLPRAFEVLGAGGRLVVVSFHSLEDREVKRFFRQMEEQGRGLVLTEKPLTPTAAEVAQNPQSRSARLRAIKRNGRLASRT
ncbi:16S rRNA (cytosine(1402)-N(4))-methyltransferase [candidate division WWE3 bacterium RBG_19FT_COMBO_53_11]|uniref:Ribosomal RNA small subunit methyltransferase H n=1 Tax=candidate division WWE3 bacterium RBG_19FT_COMBO_53_11 TaxID=1802613 RepID=A0A1F4UI11_UNCKA|nr:MAG: 16S rRNA (cytosine(1402)-N(4))-methyltransferase [candidate division WWE3 bacterium RBG_16_52_45]OGC44601.1 MAG: 16S rRNA (cytosine(1402)-N(4))-methyltransferase [candidate division WWE3 bacterium RBG_19FT_COMBO_53_11]